MGMNMNDHLLGDLTVHISTHIRSHVCDSSVQGLVFMHSLLVI